MNVADKPNEVSPEDLNGVNAVLRGNVQIELSHDRRLITTWFTYTHDDRVSPHKFSHLAGTAVIKAAYDYMKRERTERLNVGSEAEGKVRRVMRSASEVQLQGPREQQVVRAMQTLMQMCTSTEQQDALQITCDCMLGKPYPLKRLYLQKRT